jgi:hypothetical protein
MALAGDGDEYWFGLSTGAPPRLVKTCMAAKNELMNEFILRSKKRVQ